ncbi:hypothetical protein H6792_00350 [Candidatus Nomurabacteria bacterium]|nr:hypothetical protein [Candidatus Nomurabacteria bacterium]
MKILKKLGLILTFIIYLIPTAVYGTSEPVFTQPAIAPDSANVKSIDRLPSNQAQDYNLYLRSDGKIETKARIVFDNTLNQEQNSIQFTLDREIEITSAYQQVISIDCPEEELDYCPSYPEYTTDYYYNPYLKSEFFEITPSIDGQTLTLTFQKPVVSSSQSAIYLVYDYPQPTSKDSFGRYQLDWVNLQTEQKIDSINLSITTDNKVHLSNLDQRYQYINNDSYYPEATPASGDAGYQRSSLDTTIVGLNYPSQSSYQLSFANLSHNETVTVHADFSASWWRINLNQILWSLGLIIIVIACLSILVRKLTKDKNTAKSPELVSILAGITAGILTPAIISLLLWIVKQIGYNRGFSNNPDIFYPLVFLLLLIIGFILIASSLLLIPFLIWKHFSWRGLIITVVTTSIVLIIGLTLLLIVSGTSQIDQPVIEPMMY